MIALKLTLPGQQPTLQQLTRLSRNCCIISLIQQYRLLMQIHISEQDGVPIYQQIVNQVKHLVYSGRLKPEEELPSIRALAEKLLINPNTVARAYRELENEGIVIKKRTTGSYISGSGSPIPKTERLQILAGKVDS